MFFFHLPAFLGRQVEKKEPKILVQKSFPTPSGSEIAFLISGQTVFEQPTRLDVDNAMLTIRFWLIFQNQFVRQNTVMAVVFESIIQWLKQLESSLINKQGKSPRSKKLGIVVQGVLV